MNHQPEANNLDLKFLKEKEEETKLPLCKTLSVLERIDYILLLKSRAESIFGKLCKLHEKYPTNEVVERAKDYIVDTLFPISDEYEELLKKKMKMRLDD